MKKVKKCPVCNVAMFEGKPAFHELCCFENTLSVDEWTEEKKIRDTRLYNILKNMSQNFDKVEKMKYSELADFIGKSEFYGKMTVGSEEETVLNRIMNILNSLDCENEKIS